MLYFYKIVFYSILYLFNKYFINHKKHQYFALNLNF